jgi:hypothetical protein
MKWVFSVLADPRFYPTFRRSIPALDIGKIADIRWRSDVGGRRSIPDSIPRPWQVKSGRTSAEHKTSFPQQTNFHSIFWDHGYSASMRVDTLLLGGLCAISNFPHASSAPRSARSTEHVSEAKNRIFVLTDIGNEPDDSMSLVRLLVHSNLYQIEGLVAITSFWLPNATLPNMIQQSTT